MYIKIDDINIYYETYGNSRQTVLFIHGNGEDAHCFDNQIDAFSKEYRVIVADSRGHGRTGRGKGALTLKRIALDFLEFVEKLEIEDAVIVGFSDGANIAIEMALKNPERIKKLVLAGANIYPAGVNPIYQIPTVLGYWLSKAISFFDKRALKNAEVLALMVNEPHIPPEALGNISCPALVLAGDRDMILRKHTMLIHRSIINSKMVLIPKTGHFIFRDAPRLTNKAILEFI